MVVPLCVRSGSAVAGLRQAQARRSRACGFASLRGCDFFTHGLDIHTDGPKFCGMSKTPQAQRGVARTKLPERQQVEMRFLALDQMIEPEHRVRLVWRYAESCDLTTLYERIEAVEGGVGRDAVDPRLLFGLWLFATIEGVSSARRLESLTQRDLPYLWLCGGVSVNYHLLADFRAENAELLERLMIDSVAVLLHQKLITLETVAQDGMRVRAHAGSSSFRRQGSLDSALAEATDHVQRLKQEHEADPAGDDRRRQAARQRAAQELQRRIEQAQEELKQIKDQREKREGTPTSTPRASTTDPEARRMKMGDGGFRPAFNVQFASDAGTRIIVGMDVTNQGTDSGLMQPMHDQIEEDYQVTPDEYLVDGGFAKMAAVTALEAAGTAVIAPLPAEQKQLAAGKDPYSRKPGDTKEMAAFRQRMGTPEAKERYKTRSSVAEFPNADCRNRNLIQFRVRGLAKVKAQTLWHVLAFNVLRFVNLGFLETVMSG
jgi:transposase